MMVERILIICGDRNWQAPGPIYALSKRLPGDGRTIVITGGASGADTLGAAAAVDHGHRSIVVHAPWKAYGKRAGPIRNGWMLELLQDLARSNPKATCAVHAFHERIGSSKGTADMLGRVHNDATIPHFLHSDPEEDINAETQKAAGRD